MADEPLKCPTCHSQISMDAKGPTGPTARDQGSLGTDSDGNPVPRWTDDPLLTPNGFSGKDYIGEERPNRIHIEELQLDREQLETDLSISPPTDFSVLSDHGFHVRKTHLMELRESTEKILEAIGSTLADYFGLDSAGNPVTPGPGDAAKTDWTDVSRGLPYLDKDAIEKKEFDVSSGTKKPCPTFPPETRIRAIHIEDLRHAILIGWREFWAASPVQSIAMPDLFSASVVQTDTYDDPGVVTNYPGISYGDSEKSEFYITPNPRRIHTESFDDSYDPRHHTEVIESATEAGQFGFPTGLDIHTSDGGNKYIYQRDVSDDIEPAYGTKIVNPDTGDITYILDRVWIVEGYCRTHALDYIRKYLYSGGTYCPYEHYVEETYGGIPKSLVTFEIKETADSLVTAAKATAKTLKISAHADSNVYVSGPVYSWVPPQAWGFGTVGHMWYYGYGFEPISRGIYQPDGTTIVPLGIGTKANFDAKINKDTCFKFFTKVTYDGSSPKSNPSTLMNRDQWATQYMYEMRNYMSGGSTANREPNFYAASDIPSGYVPVGFGDASCVLMGLVGWQQFSIKLIFDKPPTNYPADATVVGQGKYDGQSYTFAAPWGVHSGEPGCIVIFLGDGNVETGKYDFAINFEDVFYAWSQIYSSDFAYASHKKKDDEGNIVEDPTGDYVWLMRHEFFLGACAKAGFTPGKIVGAGYPACGITVTDALVANTAGGVSLEVSAIRIQNNLKTLSEA